MRPRLSGPGLSQVEHAPGQRVCVLGGISYLVVERFTERSGRYGPLTFAPDHHGAGGKELLKLMLTRTCSNAAVRGARSSSGSGSKNIRRTRAT